MKATDFVATLDHYSAELEGILARFVKTQDAIHIGREDDSVFRQKVLELCDLFDDALGHNTYTAQIARLFNDGITNLGGSPSFRSVESIIGVVKAASVRVKRRPDLLEGVRRNSGQPPGTPILLFISHSAGDLDVASGLIDLLRAALNLPAENIRCTSVDGYRLPGGANTNEQLRREVHDARAFIGIISMSSATSTYVLFELGARWGAELHLLPVLAPGTPPSVLSGPITGLNALRSDSNSQLLQLVSDIGEQLGLVPGPPASYHAQIARVLALPARRESEPSASATNAGSDRGHAQAKPDHPSVTWLSDLARDILTAAAVDRSGSVFLSESMQGLALTANGKEFIEIGNPRSEAQARRAVSDLLAARFLERRSGDGSILHVTESGFQLADTLAKS